MGVSGKMLGFPNNHGVFLLKIIILGGVPLTVYPWYLAGVLGWDSWGL